MTSLGRIGDPEAVPGLIEALDESDLFARGLCLPSGSNLSQDDLERVVASLRRTSVHGGERRAMVVSEP